MSFETSFFEFAQDASNVSYMVQIDSKPHSWLQDCFSTTLQSQTNLDNFLKSQNFLLQTSLLLLDASQVGLKKA